MSDRPSNGEYKYPREESVDSNIVKKERNEKEHQVDKAGEYVRELLQEKVELDSQKWPIATRLIDQGKCDCCSIVDIHCFFIIYIIFNGSIYFFCNLCLFLLLKLFVMRYLLVLLV